MAVGLHHLRYFVAVAEEGNITRAAARLAIAQPSLSAQLKYLERHLGIQLLRRHRRGVELTPAGAAFLVQAKASLQAAEEAVATARTLARGQTGRLRVGFVVGTLIEPAAAILTTFRARHPQVQVELVEHTFADPSAGLNTGQVDVGVMTLPFTHRGLRFLEIAQAPRVAVLAEGHRLAGREAIAVGELFDDVWIVAETSDQVCRDFWLASDHRGGRPPRLGPATQTLDKFLQLVLAGDVVGLAAAWVQHGFARPGVRFVPVVDIEPVVTAVAWRPGAPNRLVDSFLAVARERLSDPEQAAPPA
jgi:DNA-binding transcriptional LysR family regulator